MLILYRLISKVRNENFKNLYTDNIIQFKFIFEEHCAKHLYETPLSTDQKIIEYIPGYVSITATVRYTEQLVWWIRGYGSFIEVLEPKEIRERIKNEALKLVEKYK